jgi:sugar phosphate isomerase/epimerase
MKKGESMYYTGFSDEAGSSIEAQIKATKELGWDYIESRNINGKNIHDLTDEAFEQVCENLKESGVRINCFGSTVANWSRDPRSEKDFKKSVEELNRAIPRMQKLGCTMIRGMSFTRLRDQSLYTPELEALIFKKIQTLVDICEENGIDFMHENCANYGGMSSDHTQKLIDKIDSPNFRILFDTGNPVNSVDYRKGYENQMQDAFQFYSAIKEHIAYVHIKDGRFIKLKKDEIFNDTEWCFPGEGEGKVNEIVKDLLQNGYKGGFSMEPHMALVYHDDNSEATEALKSANYVEYGKRFMTLVNDIKEDIK